MTTTESIIAVVEWKANALHEVLEPTIGTKAVEMGLRQFLNSHYTILIRLFQPLKCGLPIIKTGVDNGQVVSAIGCPGLAARRFGITLRLAARERSCLTLG